MIRNSACFTAIALTALLTACNREEPAPTASTETPAVHTPRAKSTRRPVEKAVATPAVTATPVATETPVETSLTTASITTTTSASVETPATVQPVSNSPQPAPPPLAKLDSETSRSVDGIRSILETIRLESTTPVAVATVDQIVEHAMNIQNRLQVIQINGDDRLAIQDMSGEMRKVARGLQMITNPEEKAGTLKELNGILGRIEESAAYATGEKTR